MEPFNFQEYNDPKHSSKLCMSHLSELEKDKIIERRFGLINQSPELSPLELLWDELDRNDKKFIPKSEKCGKNLKVSSIK